jgi:PAS domain S-box-containing protein
MFGYDSPQGLRDILISTVYDTPSDRKAVLSRLKSEKRLTNHEIKVRRRDGVTAWMMVNMTLIDGDTGTDGTIEGTFVDITERKRAEEEMRKAKEAAESAIAPRASSWPI